MTLKNLTFFLAMTLMAIEAKASVYEWELPHFSSERTSIDCETRGRITAEDFSTNAGVTVLDQSCHFERYSRDWTLKVLYSAEERVGIWSTMAMEQVLGLGYFNRLESCKQNLDHEISYLRQNFELAVITGYCYRTSMIGQPSFRTAVIGLRGKSLQRFEESASFSAPFIDHISAIAEIKSLATSSGLDLWMPAAYEHYLSDWMLGFSWYSEQEKSKYLHRLEGGYFKTPADCQAEVQRLKQEWDPGIAVAPLCVGRSPGTYVRTAMVWWSDSLWQEGDLKPVVYSQVYSGLDSCRAEMAQVVQNMRSSGVHVLGASCGYEDSRLARVKLQIYIASN